jgi:hypothetical protein
MMNDFERVNNFMTRNRAAILAGKFVERLRNDEALQDIQRLMYPHKHYPSSDVGGFLACLI